jgi:hypothetical protein
LLNNAKTLFPTPKLGTNTLMPLLPVVFEQPFRRSMTIQETSNAFDVFRRFGWQLPIEKPLVGPQGLKIAVGAIGKVTLRY